MKTLLHIIILAACITMLTAEQKRVLERVIPVKGNQRVVLEGFHSAKLKIVPWDKQEISVKLSVSISSGDEAQEAEYLKAMAIADVNKENGLTVSFQKPNDISVNGIMGFFRNLFRGFDFSREVAGEIYLPRGQSFTSDMRYGEVSVSGIQGEMQLIGNGNMITIKECGNVTRIENNYGPVTIMKSGGNLKLVSRSSDRIDIDEFDGPVELNTDYSEVSVRSVSKGLSIRNISGSIAMEDVLGDVVIDANYSSITALRVKGNIDISSRSSPMIRISDAGGVTLDAVYSIVRLNDIRGKAGAATEIKNQSGSISIDQLAGPLMIDADYSEITLRGIGGDVDLKSQSGTIEADSILGNWKSECTYSQITVNALRAQKIFVSNSSNPVRIRCLTAPTTVDIRNSYGDVEMIIPPSYSGAIQMDAKYGTIETDFPIRTKSLGGGAYATGKVGNGSGTLQIETTSGNIDVTRSE